MDLSFDPSSDMDDVTMAIPTRFTVVPTTLANEPNPVTDLINSSSQQANEYDEDDDDEDEIAFRMPPVAHSTIEKQEDTTGMIGSVSAASEELTEEAMPQQEDVKAEELTLESFVMAEPEPIPVAIEVIAQETAPNLDEATGPVPTNTVESLMDDVVNDDTTMHEDQEESIIDQTPQNDVQPIVVDGPVVEHMIEVPSSSESSSLVLPVEEFAAVGARAQADIASVKRKIREIIEADEQMERDQAAALAARKRARPGLYYANIQANGGASDLSGVVELHATPAAAAAAATPIVEEPPFQISCPITITMTESPSISPEIVTNLQSNLAASIAAQQALQHQLLQVEAKLDESTSSQHALQQQVVHYESIFDQQDREWRGMKKEYFAMQDAIAEAKQVQEVDMQLAEEMHAREMERMQTKLDEKNVSVKTMEEKVHKLEQERDALLAARGSLDAALASTAEQIQQLNAHMTTISEQHQQEIAAMQQAVLDASAAAFTVECPISISMVEEIIQAAPVEPMEDVSMAPETVDQAGSVNLDAELVQELQQKIQQQVELTQATVERSNHLHGQIDALTAAMSEKDAQLAESSDLKKQLDHLTAKLAEHAAVQELSATLQTQVDTLTQHLFEHQSLVSGANAQATMQSEKLNALDSEVTNLRTTLTAKNAEVLDLSERLTVLEGENDRLTKLVPNEKTIAKLVKATREAQKKSEEVAVEKVKLQLLSAEMAADGTGTASTILAKPLLKTLLGVGAAPTTTLLSAATSRPKLLLSQIGGATANTAVTPVAVVAPAPKQLKVQPTLLSTGVKLGAAPVALKTLGTGKLLGAHTTMRQEMDKENAPMNM